MFVGFVCEDIIGGSVALGEDFVVRSLEMELVVVEFVFGGLDLKPLSPARGAKGGICESMTELVLSKVVGAGCGG